MRKSLRSHVISPAAVDIDKVVAQKKKRHRERPRLRDNQTEASGFEVLGAGNGTDNALGRTIHTGQTGPKDIPNSPGANSKEAGKGQTRQNPQSRMNLLMSCPQSRSFPRRRVLVEPQSRPPCRTTAAAVAAVHVDSVFFGSWHACDAVASRAQTPRITDFRQASSSTTQKA